MSVRYYDWIAHHGRRNPGKIALVDLASGRRFPYGELDRRVSRRVAATRCRAAITPAARKKPRVAAKRPFGT